MNNTLQLILNFDCIAIFNSGKLDKRFYFEKAGIKLNDIKSKLAYCCKIIDTAAKKGKDLKFRIFLDYSYMQYSEHIEMQEKGNEKTLEQIKPTKIELISCNSKYFNNSKEIENTKKLNTGDQYYELLEIYKWKPEIIKHLISIMSLEHNNFIVLPVHNLLSDSISMDYDNNKLIIEIGDLQTVVSLYKGGILHKCFKIDKGVAMLIDSITEQFSIPFQLASKLVYSHGMLIAKKQYANFVIDIPLNEYFVREVPIPMLSGIIQNFFSALYRKIASEVSKNNFDISNVIVTGKANAFGSFKNYTELYFNSPVSLIDASNALASDLYYQEEEPVNTPKEEIPIEEIIIEKQKEAVSILEHSSIKKASQKLKNIIYNLLEEEETKDAVAFTS